MTGSPAIDIRDLHVRRGKNEVLHGIDVQVPSGSITGLLGPSGCGKTTLMRCVVGTQIVESGTVTVLGSPAGSVSLRSRVGYVTQSPSVYSDLTVKKNVAYFAALYGQPSNAVTEAVDAVGLTRFATQKAADLSGGQLGRVSLACALVARPEILVLDEPTVGLDPLLRVELWERFDALADAVPPCSCRATSWTRPSTALRSSSCATATFSRRSPPANSGSRPVRRASKTPS